MWEAYDLQNQDLLWAAIPFMGGIAGKQQAPCGAVSSAAVSLAFRYRRPLQEKEAAKEARNKIRALAHELVEEFEKQFGTIVCLQLIGFETSTPEGRKRFRESELWKEKCGKAVAWTIEKLYAFEAREP